MYRAHQPQDLLHDSGYSFTRCFVEAHSPLEERENHPYRDLHVCVRSVKTIAN